MIKIVDRVRVLILIIKNWGMVKKSLDIIQNPNDNVVLLSKLTVEEINAINDLEVVGRILCCSPKIFSQEIKILKEVVDSNEI